jgi:hypothetical protein
MRTLVYDTPSADAVFLEGEVQFDGVTPELPFTFRVPCVRAQGAIDMEATVALVNEIADRMEEDMVDNPDIARVPENLSEL